MKRQKQCPKCNSLNGGAQKQCECGHVFYGEQKKYVNPDKNIHEEKAIPESEPVVIEKVKETAMNKIPADTMRRSVPIRVRLTMLEFVELIQKLRRIGIDTQLNIGIRG